MHQPDQHAHEPKGPTTGPLHPVIVVMDTIDEEEDPRLHEATLLPHNKDDEEQDRLPPVPEKEGSVLPAQQPEEEPKEPDDEPGALTSTPPSPREPRPLSLPVATTAHTHRPRSLLIIGSLGISLILLAVALGILLAVNLESLSPILTILPGVTPRASVTLTPAQERLHTVVPLTAVTGTPDPTRGQVRARLLSVQSIPFTHTVPTSGHGHTRAQAAGGTLTFYNAAPYAQTVAAGTVLTGGMASNW